MKKYAIMGGTFNPIHMGHLMISEYIRNEMGIDEVIFIPTGNPPHKKTIDSDIRYKMVSLAIEDNPYFSISDIETKKNINSYSVDTVREIQSTIEGKFYFIIGSDTLFQLKTWKRFDELAKNIEFICAMRPQYLSTKALEMELKYLSDKYEATVHIIETPLYEISSTDLRSRIQNGKSVKYLIPQKVIDYIEEANLYEEI